MGARYTPGDEGAAVELRVLAGRPLTGFEANLLDGAVTRSSAGGVASSFRPIYSSNVYTNADGVDTSIVGYQVQFPWGSDTFSPEGCLIATHTTNGTAASTVSPLDFLGNPGSSARSVVRDAIEDELGESLSDYEYFFHGTTRDIAKDFKPEMGRRLFTSVDPNVARMFGERTVAKMGSGEVGGVAIVLPKQVVQSLRASRQLIVKSIDDMPQLKEWIFEPGAYEALRNHAEIVVLPPGSF